MDEWQKLEHRKKKLINAVLNFVTNYINLDEYNKSLQIFDRKNLVIAFNLKHSLYYMFNVHPTLNDKKDKNLIGKIEYDPADDTLCLETIRIVYEKRTITAEVCDDDKNKYGVYLYDKESDITLIFNRVESILYISKPFFQLTIC